jgi:hypothetical protein
MRASKNAQQVRAAIAPTKARSPLSKVKRDRTALRTSLELSARKRILLSAKCHRNKEKITHLKRLNNQVEIQLLEIIEGLELMNYELVDKVKSAKRTERAAIKLYDKSKEVA